jgi:2-(1,2-epoxy-1,2-dihydrophenyl)acetyl-CoA isomerase
MSTDPVLLERDAAMAVITLNRPDAGNALDIATKELLLAHLREVAQDTTVRAVLLTGVGATFCVGQDLKELVAMLRDDPTKVGDTVEAHFNPITELLATMPKPVVAGVNGTCVGAGLGFALACDLQVWSAEATLATAFSGVALTCDSGLSKSLARSVGVARAASLILLGGRFSISEAQSWGLAGEIVDPEEVVGRARALTQQLADGPTSAFAATKRLLAVAPDLPMTEVLSRESAEQVGLGQSPDHLEAVTAFLAKRPPVFSGRADDDVAGS